MSALGNAVLVFTAFTPRACHQMAVGEQQVLVTYGEALHSVSGTAASIGR